MSMAYAEALQTALAAEHAALYVYGALGAQTSQSGAPTLFAALTDAYDAHRARRDQLVAILTDLGEQPVPAEPVYELPKNLDSTDAVTARALEIERSCASTYAYLVANSPAPERRLAVNLLIQTAVRELAFRGTPETLPGSDEYADR
jgi:uncharacterized protein DUF4439